jgi:putative DNA-invertase from lambdoid prophage Rac
VSATRAALYHRVSTDSQSPENARHELKHAAAVRGMSVVLDIEETGSGARNDRPGLQKVMEAARRGTIDVVIVHKLDRWGRSALDLLANIRTLEEQGVRFIALSQGLDIKPTGDAMSRLILTVLAAVSEFERDLIKDRTLLGIARARAAGRKLGRPRVTVDRALATRLRASGATYAAIAAQLGVSVGTVHAALSAPESVQESDSKPDRLNQRDRAARSAR